MQPIKFQHKSTPYCHIPCYSALFGPKLFGHGSRVESHRNFGRRENSFIREQKSLEKQTNTMVSGFSAAVDEAVETEVAYVSDMFRNNIII